VSAQAVLVDHRVLFITVGSSSTTGDFLKLALDGYGEQLIESSHSGFEHPESLFFGHWVSKGVCSCKAAMVGGGQQPPAADMPAAQTALSGVDGFVMEGCCMV